MDFVFTITVTGDKANYSTNGVRVPTQVVLQMLQDIGKQILADLVAKSTIETPEVKDGVHSV
jgi:hypothetical protein